jgi:AraC-like DNA-binding protein
MVLAEQLALLGLPEPGTARVVDAYARHVLDCAASEGVCAAALGMAGGLPASLPVAHYIALLDQAANTVSRPGFGLRVGAHMRPTAFVTYGHVVLTSATVGEAIEQTRRFEGLAHDLGRSELIIEGEVAIYRWHCPWLTQWPSRHLPESVMASVQQAPQWLLANDVPMLALAFTHSAPDEAEYRDEYARIFRAPVVFDAPFTEARFLASALSIAIPNADRQLFPLVERYAVQQMQARDEAMRFDAIVRDVREAIAKALARDRVQIADIARALDMTVRTLQRRLSLVGVSFGQLLDQTRRELAEHYLADSTISLTEVSFLLGFSQPSSLTTACRSWHGCTPMQWRQRRVAGA